MRKFSWVLIALLTIGFASGFASASFAGDKQGQNSTSQGQDSTSHGNEDDPGSSNNDQ
jgi:hypothetical protein